MPISAARFWIPLVLTGLAALCATLWHTEPRVGRLWINTTLLAATVCLIAVPLGTLAALTIFKTDVPGRRIAGLLFTGMLLVPLYVVTGAWDAGFGIQGWHTLVTNPHLAHEPWLDGWRAAIWVHALAAVPWVVLIVGAGLRTVEAELEEDAATFTTPLRVIWHVTLRRAAPALVVACIWVAVVAAVEISVTDFFQVRTFAEEVYTQAALGTFGLIDPITNENSEHPLRAYGLWLGLLLSTLLAQVAIVAASRLFSQLTDSPHRATWIWHLGRWRRSTALALVISLLLVAGLPLANLMYKAGILVTATPEGHVRSWSAMKVAERIAAAPVQYSGELMLSTCIGAAAATGALAVALPLAWSMRLSRKTPRLRPLGLALCLTIPGPLLGLATIHVLNQPPDSPLSALAILYDSNFAPWLVQTIRALPLVALVVWSALASVPQTVLDAAALEGAGWWSQLLRIAVPLRWSGLAAAWLVGFAIAVGEVAATVLVVPPQQSTYISVRIFQLLHYGVDDRMAAICLVMIAGTATLTGIAATLLKRTFWRGF
jgi:iron(III) transport system permease protein